MFQIGLQERLPKWRQRFVKNGFKKTHFFFLSKSSKFCAVWAIRCCSNFTSTWYTHFFKGINGETLDFQCQH